MHGVLSDKMFESFMITAGHYHVAPDLANMLSSCWRSVGVLNYHKQGAVFSGSKVSVCVKFSFLVPVPAVIFGVLGYCLL